MAHHFLGWRATEWSGLGTRLLALGKARCGVCRRDPAHHETGAVHKVEMAS